MTRWLSCSQNVRCWCPCVQFADFRVLYQARCQRRLPAPARCRPRPAAQLQPPSLPAKQQHTSKHAAELAKQHSDAVNGMEQLLWWDAASRRLVWLATTALLGDTILRAAAQAVAEPPLLTSAMWLVSIAWTCIRWSRAVSERFWSAGYAAWFGDGSACIPTQLPGIPAVHLHARAKGHAIPISPCCA